MNVYCIGDVQGCADELCRLLERVKFTPGRDRVYLLGDLVNRGPKSLQTLRLARSLGDDCQALLGNHDLSILSRLALVDTPDSRHKLNHTAAQIHAAADGQELYDWLRHRPLAIALNTFAGEALLIHAGLPPQWSCAQALACAAEVEQALRGPDERQFFASMYGDLPDIWSTELRGAERLRFIVNCLTRLRYCSAEGRLALEHRQSNGEALTVGGETLLPWFAVPGRASRDQTILFGHWSTLRQVHWPQHQVWGLDTGCVWGGSLSALNVSNGQLTQLPCNGYKKPAANLS